MTITKTLLLAGLTVASLAGPAMAQEAQDLGQLYWAEKSAEAAPSVGQARSQSHSFFYRSSTVNQGTVGFPSTGGGEG